MGFFGDYQPGGTSSGGVGGHNFFGDYKRGVTPTIEGQQQDQAAQKHMAMSQAIAQAPVANQGPKDLLSKIGIGEYKMAKAAIPVAKNLAEGAVETGVGLLSGSMGQSAGGDVTRVMPKNPTPQQQAAGGKPLDVTNGGYTASLRDQATQGAAAKIMGVTDPLAAVGKSALDFAGSKIAGAGIKDATKVEATKAAAERVAATPEQIAGRTPPKGILNKYVKPVATTSARFGAGGLVQGSAPGENQDSTSTGQVLKNMAVSAGENAAFAGATHAGISLLRGGVEAAHGVKLGGKSAVETPAETTPVVTPPVTETPAPAAEGQPALAEARPGEAEVAAPETPTSVDEPTINESRATTAEPPAPAEPGATEEAAPTKTLSSDQTPTSKNKYLQNIRQIVAPATTSQAAHDAALAVREYKGAPARVASQEAVRGDAAFKSFDKMTPEEQMAQTSEYERTGKFPNEQPGYSDMYHKSSQAAQKTLESVYEGSDFGRIQNYVRRNWVFDNPDQESAAIHALYGLGRTLRPSTSNLKTRVLDMPVEDAQKFMEEKGIQAHLAVTNPELLRRQMLVGAEQARGWKQLGEDLKANGLMKFVKIGQKVPDGYRTVSDRAFQVLYPGEVKFHESYDAQIMGKLKTLARDLGVTHKRQLTLTGPGSRRDAGRSTLGLSFLPTEKRLAHREAAKAAKEAGTPLKKGPAGEVHTRFGSSETVLTHEIGHELDRIYGIKGNFLSDVKKVKTEGLDGKKRIEYTGKNGQTYKELVDLAAKRGMGRVGYPVEHEELIANLLHAYVHAPELLNSVAPTAKLRLDSLIDQHPELQQIREIKPSLQGMINEESKVIGMVHGGQFVFPEDTARILDNAVSRGLEGHAVFRGVRSVKNGVNMLNLGLSAFHAGTESLNSSIQDLGQGERQIASGHPIRGVKTLGRGLTPGASVTRLAIKGSKAMKEIAKTDPLLHTAITDAIDRGGFRLKQAQSEHIAMKGTIRNAIANGQYGAAAGRLIPTMIEKASAPIMEHLVPNVKLGAYLDRVQQITETHTGTDAELADKLAKASDSVDNIFGQLAYDNLFWNKTFRDLAQLSQRSLGWNLGTVREIGGGIADVKGAFQGKGLTNRTLYAINLPILVGAYGALYTYLHTGKGPESLTDYFYPRTGGTDPNGNPERVVLPSYMKDVRSYSNNPFQTVLNKTSPVLSIPASLMAPHGGQDYYGNMIRNPDDPVATQLEQVGSYLLKSLAPFSFTNSSQRTSQGLLSRAETAIGITPAPAAVTRTPFANRVLTLYGNQLGQGPQTPEQQQVTADKQKAREQLLTSKGQNHTLLDKMVSKGEMTKTSQQKFLDSSQDTSVQRAFAGLSMVNKQKVLQGASAKDLAGLGNLHAIQVEAAKTLANKNSTDANKKAAGEIISMFGGDTGKLEGEAKAQTKAKAAATRAAHHK